MNKQAAITPFSLPDRSAEILALVRVAFVEKGFDGASMQDLARAAGMSVGNFYRYFPSKDALIEAMVQLDMAEIEGDFAAILGSPDPLGGLRAKIAERLQDDCDGDGALWAEITAAAHRKPEIARICSNMEDLVAGNLLAVFARLTGLSAEACEQRFSAHARFLILLVKASSTGKSTETDADLQALVLRNIETTLAEVTAASNRD